MKSGLRKLVFASLSVCTLAQCADQSVGAQQVIITNATAMPVIIRALRRDNNQARWNCLLPDDQAFNRSGGNFPLAERTEMTSPMVLNPGESRRLVWLESWKFDLVFAPMGSDLANRISQGRCSMSKEQVLSNFHQGNWANIQAGTRVILYLVSSEAAKRHFLRNDITKNLVGKNGNQPGLIVGKINAAVIREVDKQLTSAQASTQQRAFIDVVRTENQ